MDRLRAVVVDDVAEERLTAIDRLGTKVINEISNSPVLIASGELKLAAIKRRLKRPEQPIKTQGKRHNKTSHHVRLDVPEDHVIRTAIVLRLMQPNSDNDLTR